MSGATDLVPDRWRDGLSLLPSGTGPSATDWGADLPRLLTEVLDGWGLTPDGPGRTGRAALVLPVRRDGEELALKVVWPHAEGAGEPLALRHWAGDGAVRLVAADPARGALLLERLDPTTDLTGVAVDGACEVVGSLLGRLHIPPPPRVRRLSETLPATLDRMAGRSDLPRRMVDRVRGLAGELLADPDVDATLLHTDLHYRKVLAADREPWLAVGPKPLAGPPGFEIHPLLRNRVAELGTGSAFRWGVRRRLSVTCEAAGIDEEAARLWSIVRTGLRAREAAAAGDSAAVSLDVAMLKALED